MKQGPAYLNGDFPSDDSTDEDFSPNQILSSYDESASSSEENSIVELNVFSKSQLDSDLYSQSDEQDYGSQSSDEYSDFDENDFQPNASQQSSINRDTLKELLAQFDKGKIETEDHLLERNENSVVKVFIHHKSHDYDSPWMPPQPVSATGSGFVINYEGKPYLMTNAHVADSTTLLEVRLADEAHKYPARVQCVDNDCDLALLAVDDPTFWTKAKPLELGEMPHVRQDLQVFGFPMGGDGFCITQGQVSRIEVNPYAQSDVSLLQAQVSAAINPGNSGGPAIHDGKVMGVAFQGYNAGEGLGYIIPPPIMKHFLKDATSPEAYKGFPDLAIETQNLTNPKLRKLSGMTEEQTGIRIKKVAPLSSAKGFLQKDDILLELDGKPIKNDGTVALDYSKRLHYNHLINRKFIGETITTKILRDGETLTFELPLTNRSNTTYYSTKEYDKAPSFYIVSGLVMMPLTDNFIDDASGFFSRVDIDLEQFTSKQKKELGEEIVFIHTALATEKTKDTLGYQGSIIKEVNGVEIKNIRDAIAAFEGNTDQPHVITTRSDDKLVVDNLSKADNKAILKAFSIPKDRSEDLNHEPNYRPGCPEATAILNAFAQTRNRDADNDDAQTLKQQQKQKRSI